MTLCPHCLKPLDGYKRVKLWRHTFNPILASALSKFAHGVGRKGKNEIHLRHDLNLTTDELNNFTKVRFFGLVAKVRVQGKRKGGYWLLTRRGSQFLKGQIAIPRTVITQDNHVIGHGEETITIRDLAGLPPIDLAYEIADGDTYIPVLHQPRLSFTPLPCNAQT